MTSKHENIDAYLATVAAHFRATLETLREQIRGLYPEATEHISYNQPLFKLDGHPLAGFYAAKHHCALFVWSDTALATLGDLLDGYDRTLGTVRFGPDRPLPEDIVKAIVEARAKEIRDRWGVKRSGSRTQATGAPRAER
jgi:uncharacterized protein YdhG (YjbR/CyaY superfamily)